ncbi:nucleotide sugar dehydrogenase [Patescibacteria group bacterium]
MIKNKVAIIGLGYVGLPLACAIAYSKTYQTVGFDIDKKKIQQIREKKVPIEDKFTKQKLKEVNVDVSNSEEIINKSEYLIVCVPTPVSKSKKPNLSPIKNACNLIKKQLEPGQNVIIESTINPGICEEVVLPILEKSGLKGGLDFNLSHCPERINPGDNKWNTLNIPRNIGSLTLQGNKKSADFYRSFMEADITELSTLKAAEASKIIENTFRDINIAYVNELAKSFDIMGIDLVEVINAAANKPFAFMPHFPSCGVGGHCIPVDPYYLISSGKKNGFNHTFLKKAREVNESMPKYNVDLLLNKIKQAKLKTKKINVGVLGLSYKANVADLRESPSLKIIEILEKKKINYKTFDPHFPDISTTNSLSELLQFADAVVLGTSHKEFLNINADSLKQNNIKIVIDGKNCLNKKEIIEQGIIYKGVGH